MRSTQRVASTHEGQLLLNSPVPILAVKLPDDGLPSSSFRNVLAGMRGVTG